MSPSFRIQKSQSSNSLQTYSTTSTRNTRPYDTSFLQALIDGGCFPNRYRYPDGQKAGKRSNWEEINKKLRKPRPSLPSSRFSEEAFEKFAQADADAHKEKQVMESVIPFIEGDTKDAKCISGGIAFSNLANLTDVTLAPGNPDRYYGARPEQLKRPVRNELSRFIVPTSQDDLPIAPNLFLAGKSKDGSIAVAERQVTYDGALGARGMSELRSYGQGELTHDNEAHTITVIYHAATLRIYTVHRVQPKSSEERPEYHMNLLNGWLMSGSPTAFLEGITAFRNAVDWAKERRDRLIEDANARFVSLKLTTSSSAPGITTEGPPVSVTTLSTIDRSQPQNRLSTHTQVSGAGVEHYVKIVKPVRRSSRQHNMQQGASRLRAIEHL
ncbi:hypothetical protein MMC25_003176 [Agyrium rufum]|nr:hypothetical protein [Agyrium rufum]